MNRAYVFGTVLLVTAVLLPSRRPVWAQLDTDRSTAIDVPACRVQLSQRALLSSAETGVVAEVIPQEGEFVRAGTVLVRLDDSLAQLAVEIARAEAENPSDLRAAEVAAKFARMELENALAANQRLEGAISPLDLERLRAAVEETAIQVEQAKHRRRLLDLRYKEATAKLERLRLRAPFDGVVSRIQRYPGEGVKPGDDIVELASTETVRVEGYIDVESAAAVRQGCAVEVRLATAKNSQSSPEGASSAPGRLVFVDASVQPVSEKVRIWAEVPNAGGTLMPGLLADMKILTNRDTEPPTRPLPAFQQLTKSQIHFPIPIGGL